MRKIPFSILTVSGVLLGNLFGNTAVAEINYYASLELNVDAINRSNSSTAHDQDGFVELGISTQGDWDEYFLLAKASVRLRSDGSDRIDLRDLFVQFGTQSYDFKVGQFEAIDLFPVGKDTIVSHAAGVTVYQANKVRGFTADDGGQVAFRYKFSNDFKLEVDALVGDDETAGGGFSSVSGIRPSVTWSYDDITVSAGMEKVKYDLVAGGDIEQTGYVVTSNFDVVGADINLSATHLDNDSGNSDVSSYALNMVYGDFGAGMIYSDEEVAGRLTTTYVAYSVPFFAIEDAIITFGASYSEAELANGENDNTALRVRLNYSF